MYPLMALLFFGCFIVSLTLAPKSAKIVFAFISLWLLVVTGFWGIMNSPRWN